MTQEYLTDGAIVDLIKPVLQGSKGYYTEIEKLINRHDRPMFIEFNIKDIPVELEELFWKKGEAARIIQCLNQAVQDVFSNIFPKDDPSNSEIDYDKIEAKIVWDSSREYERK